jgi:hypothetical protein
MKDIIRRNRETLGLPTDEITLDMLVETNKTITLDTIIFTGFDNFVFADGLIIAA